MNSVNAIIMAIQLAFTAAALGQQIPVQAPADDERTWLDHRRLGIENELDTAVTRRNQAVELLLRRSESARELAVSLLTSPSGPSTRLILCQAVEEVGHSHPELLDGRLVVPLLTALADTDNGVSRAAGSALSVYPDWGVDMQLAALAADNARSLPNRVAAVEALAPNVHRREVVAHLIQLLKAGDPLTPQVVKVLKKAAETDYGEDLDAWRSWWDRQSKLSETEWLLDCLELRLQLWQADRRRVAELETTVDRLEERHRKEMEEVLRALYRQTPDGQAREELLASWLRHEGASFRWMAGTLIKERIPDGVLPSPVLQTELRNRLGDPAPEVRRAVLAIVGALHQPLDAEVVIGGLATETVPSVREMQFRVLGQLQNPLAIPCLLKEIQNPEAEIGGVTEAVMALGILAGKAGTDSTQPVDLSQAIGPLRQWLNVTSPDAIRLKRAVLSTMAVLALPAFESDFATYLRSDVPDLVVPAIEGVVALAKTEGVETLVSLLRHPDPSVRRAAAVGVATLATDPSHLEVLFSLCDSTVEPAEGVRECAWTGSWKWLRSRSLEEQLSWISRLPIDHERRIEALQSLLEEFSAKNGDSGENLRVLRLLADTLRRQGRFAEELIQRRRIHEFAPDYDSARDVVLAAVHSGEPGDLPQVLTQLLQDANVEQRGELSEAILAGVEKLRDTGDRERLDGMVASLEEVVGEALGARWLQKLHELKIASSPSSAASAGEGLRFRVQDRVRR